MKARYETQVEHQANKRCPNGCLDNYRQEWHIIIERIGKPTFIICSTCGTLIKKVSA